MVSGPSFNSMVETCLRLIISKPISFPISVKDEDRDLMSDKTP